MQGFTRQMPELFTIGHSNHSWEHFLESLERHRLQVVVDVRSSPYSSRAPQYNRESLKATLRGAGIQYLFLGEELGARRSEPACYIDGIARYDLIAKTAAFRTGIERVTHGTQSYRCVLMCAERDPLQCHRTILVCRHLRDAAQIQHIRADGTLELHAEAERRLMIEESIPTEDLFSTRDELLARAYDQRGGKIAYRKPAVHQEKKRATGPG